MQTDFRGRLGCAAVLLAAGLAAAGCGGSSSSNPDGLAEGFIGHWEVEGATTSYTLTCPNTVGAVSFPIWTDLVLEHGVLSDLTDVSTACAPPGMSFDVDKKGVVATVVAPDPYTSNAPLCRFVVGSDSNGLPVYIDFSFTSLTFTKLQDSGTGAAPRALWGGAAAGPLMEDDGTNTGNLVQADSCTYSGSGDIFHRTTQP
jgi:hypothetical protein